jgi:hypothetical protein
MAIRVYLMPRIGSGLSHLDARRPKYPLSKARCIRCGQEMFCVVIADVTNAEHTAVSANADVRAFPADLDTTVNAGARTTIVDTLEAMRVPAQWVTVGMTYRALLRRLVGMFFVLQSLEERNIRLLSANLDAPVSSLAVGARQALEGVGLDLSFDSSAVHGSTSLRAVLAGIGAQFAARSFKARGVDL